MFPRLGRNRGIVFPSNTLYDPTVQQVIVGSDDSAAVTWTPGDTGTGRGVFGIEYQSGTTQLVLSSGSAPTDTVAFPAGGVTTRTGLQLTSGTGSRYGAIAGTTIRTRLVTPSVASPAQLGAFRSSAAVAPPAWNPTVAPSNYASGRDDGQIGASGGFQRHQIGLTRGATVAGYVTTGYSGMLALISVSDRYRNGVLQAGGFGVYDLVDYGTLVFNVHPDDGATWTYKVYVYVYIGSTATVDGVMMLGSDPSINGKPSSLSLVAQKL